MSEIKPALTAEEWEMGYASNDVRIELRSGGRVGVTVHAYPLGGGLGYPRDLPALAAFCLHNQPFGFTREDAINHREGAKACVLQWQTIGPGSLHDWHESMADRIEALLPPEEK